MQDIDERVSDARLPDTAEEEVFSTLTPRGDGRRGQLGRMGGPWRETSKESMVMETLQRGRALSGTKPRDIGATWKAGLDRVPHGKNE